MKSYKKIINWIVVIILTVAGLYICNKFWGLNELSNILLIGLILFYVSDKIFNLIYENWIEKKDMDKPKGGIKLGFIGDFRFIRTKIK